MKAVNGTVIARAAADSLICSENALRPEAISTSIT